MKIILSQQDKSPVKCGGAGLSFEDVNYSLDGGLYAEMLENRNFEAQAVEGGNVSDDGGYGWEVYPNGADAALKIKTDRPLYSENPHYLRLTVNAPFTGVKNKAFDGIYLEAKKEYKISFFVRSYAYKGAALVGVYQNGTPLLQKKVKIKPDGQWHRFSLRLKSKTDAENADFCFMLAKPGAVHLDCFSMIPSDAVLGVFRRDLAVLLKEMKPSFLRFPGDCAAEGYLGKNRYLWKYSIGQAERRKHNWNSWAEYGAEARQTRTEAERLAASHCAQSLGVGYYEYFRLAEYLGAKPVPVVYLGEQNLAEEEEEFYLQDALDVVEFACGGSDTLWGRVRAEMGHSEPFALEYLAVSGGHWNKRGDEKKSNKKKRLEMLEKRIQEKYPAVKIADTEKNLFVPSAELYKHTNALASCKGVCSGVYAAVSNAEKNTPQVHRFEDALAEAAYLTAMEGNRNALLLKSYAPVFARLGYTQVCPALIWFNGNSVCLSADYYVQKLFSIHTGDEKLGAQASGENVYVSATSRDAFTFVKAVNAGGETLDTEVEGDFDFGALTQIIRLSANPEDCNTFEEPEKILPETVAPTGARTLTLPPYSFQVLIFKK